MKGISVVVTVRNDDEGIKRLKQSLNKQTRKPDEVIIIRAEDYGNCNRAEGRNIGIKKAKHEVIAVTDVGCRPHRDWLERLTVMRKSEAFVVAGFYRTITRTPLQAAIAPYLAVMPNQWSESYLPASRSIAFTKKAWELVGGYPEEAKSGAEDLVFAWRLKRHPKIKMILAPDALVDWESPDNLRDFFWDIVKHTRGNVEVRYWPHLVRNLTVVLRWGALLVFPVLIPWYLAWPIVKHLKGLSFQSLMWLPAVQLVADGGVIYGMMRMIKEKYFGQIS